MGFSKPSVSIAMKKLKEKKLIEVNEKGHITLTSEGYEIAKKTYEKHELLIKLLIYIGVPRAIAENDACKMEHSLSDETVVKLKEFAEKIDG